tara:strand:+ start:13629 stop:14516 length:888 start_codon:yes stop_codon:yes gene_type:complete
MSKFDEIEPLDYIVTGKQKLRLKEHPTHIAEFYEDKSGYKDSLNKMRKEINDLQRMMYAHGRYSLLLIFQAMDAAGKDGTIRAVMSGVNPHGVMIHAFTRPSTEELAHDFLWRTTLRLPNRGHIGIFNRSYYEEVLVARVHPAILEKQNLPNELIDNPKKLWSGRFESICDFEKHMERNGTRVVKFFLHLGYEEQRKRFLERIDKPHKNWKFEDGDIRERRHWEQFQDAYEETINSTATPQAPWYVVPADDKKNMRLIVARILLEQLRSLDMHYPHVSDERREELKRDRKLLEND